MTPTPCIGSATIPIDTDYTSRIPSIAYIVPDLEAYIQLSLIDESNGDEVACIQSTVSNGLSTRQASITWATGFIALAAFLASIIATAISYSQSSADKRTSHGYNRRVHPNPIAWLFIDYITFIQHIVLTGMLSINYPVAYSSYVQNFSWAFGLFTSSRGTSSSESNFQTAITRMRQSTGAGTNVTGALNPLVWGERGLSPYNVADPSASSSSLFKRGSVFGKQLATPYVQNGGVIGPGIPNYVNTMGISTVNAAMTVWLSIVIVFAICLGAVLVGWMLLWLLTRRKRTRRKTSEIDRVSSPVVLYDNYWGFAGTMFIRLVSLQLREFTTIAHPLNVVTGSSPSSNNYVLLPMDDRGQSLAS